MESLKVQKTSIASVVISAALIISFLGVPLYTDAIPHPEKSFDYADGSADLSGVHVAIYQGYIDYYDQRVNQSLIALTHMFEWMNATVVILNHTQIIDGALFGFELLAVPEGLGPRLESRLTDDGLQAIKDWLALGGSYVGVRGSAAMAVKDSYFEGITTVDFFFPLEHRFGQIAVSRVTGSDQAIDNQA